MIQPGLRAQRPCDRHELCPWKIGGISVPKAAQYPKATAIPSDMPK